MVINNGHNDKNRNNSSTSTDINFGVKVTEARAEWQGHGSNKDRETGADAILVPIGVILGLYWDNRKSTISFAFRTVA